MPLVVHGIPNCNTVKKARTWLEERGLAYTFHDFKKQGVPEAALDEWIHRHGWETLVNRAGTTWRQLDDATKAGVTDAASARALMLAKPSVIKRPVVAWGAARGDRVTVGFKPEQFDAAASPA
jgi:Spx/MgsR family transcriptional regulator